jgi:predicted RNA-binding Zn ribbon-like protein
MNTLNKQDEEVSVFEFTGGNICLDFINTLSNRLKERPTEHLLSYRDLVFWGKQAELITFEDVQQLLEVSRHRPDEANRVYERALMLREILFRIFSACIEDVRPDGADIELFNGALNEVLSHTCIVPQDDRFVWSWRRDGALDVMLWPVLRAAADLLTSDERQLIRKCAADDCNWLFLDTSKNHSRRWCDMKGCGNRAKVRKHHERKRQVARQAE